MRSLSQLWSLRRRSRIKMVKFMAKITAISIFSDSNLGLLEGKKNSADMVLSEKEDKFYVLVAHWNQWPEGLRYKFCRKNKRLLWIIISSYTNFTKSCWSMSLLYTNREGAESVDNTAAVYEMRNLFLRFHCKNISRPSSTKTVFCIVWPSRERRN